MYTKTVTYTNFRDQEVTEDVHFHLNKADLVKWQVETGGLEQHLKNIGRMSDPKDIFAEFKVILLRAYGKLSEDGLRFIKNDRIRAEFEESDAMGEIIIDLMVNSQAGADLVNGIIPNNFEADVAKIELKQKMNQAALLAQPSSDIPAAIVDAPAVETAPEEVVFPPNPLAGE